MKYSSENRFLTMYMIDKSNREFIINYDDDFEFLYQNFTYLRKTNSSISAINYKGEVKLVKANTIKYISIRNNKMIKIRIF